MHAEKLALPRPATPDALLTVNEAAAVFGVCRATFWTMVGDGRAPKQIKIGSASRWSVCDLMDAIARLKATARAA
ncbi:putative DNA-binding transcriptional regulator AlpA [Rhizobium sp. BK196]|uniref:helix-turn-helix transcriptional regulator n=1 Tax=Rhizobium TaxID=379 RepID=UPI0010318A55|nr:MULTISPECIES: DNA-binding protein [Rhizobium]MBB3310985.1 putative DNA-binding transcriptional regulator AlpA [Rhizobium sp. BK196]MBX4858492.1 DNA-binding protein [Rhizobium bangladeshense]TAY73532.1 DNA-binding protein [Rhizobium ruizarguesonis]TBG36600.1 DNA-binding protein [Rhizobium leguminosarum]